MYDRKIDIDAINRCYNYILIKIDYYIYIYIYILI